MYSAQERSQAYLVNAERVAAGLPPASIASICRSRRRSDARHAELQLAEAARRSEPTVPRPNLPAPPPPRRRPHPPPEEDEAEAEGGDTPLMEAPESEIEFPEDDTPWDRRVRSRAATDPDPDLETSKGVAQYNP